MGTLSSRKRILVTGASRGIGRAAAVALARRGHTLVLAARSVDGLREVQTEINAWGGSAECLVMDVTSDESVRGGVARLLETGPCDIVINNAGTCHQATFLTQPTAARRAEMELNYWGAQNVTEAILPSMIQRRTGTVVNVSSLLGCIAAPTTANYSGTKAALNAWSHALRGEVAPFGINVVVFIAPHTQTELGRRTEFEGVPSLEVDYTARELIRAVDRAPREYAASPVYRLLLRLARLFPSFMERQVAASAPRRFLVPTSAAPLESGLDLQFDVPGRR